ncbi:MAG: hypothetical protein AAFN74_24545, partial [Myxococcota bacterium]
MEPALNDPPTIELGPEDVVEGTDDLPVVEPQRGAAINAPTSSTINPSPYVGPYRLLAKFPSSSAGEVFLGVRRTEFG